MHDGAHVKEPPAFNIGLTPTPTHIKVACSKSRPTFQRLTRLQWTPGDTRAVQPGTHSFFRNCQVFHNKLAKSQPGLIGTHDVMLVPFNRPHDEKRAALDRHASKKHQYSI